MSEAPRCTMTFATDLRDFPSNPHKARTPFGFPQTVSIGDAFAELEALTTRAESAEARIAELEAALDGDAPGSGAHWRFWSDKARAATNRALVATTRAEAAEAEVKRLREALRPFAEQSKRFDEAMEHFGVDWPTDHKKPATSFTHAQLRAARKAYEESSNDQ